MSTRSESFGRLLKGAINSIAAYEGKTAPAIEDELGQQLGLAGSAIQRYKAGYLPPEPRAIAVFAEAGVRRGFLARAWLSRFLQAARYPAPDALLAQLADALGVPAPIARDGLPGGTVALLFTDIAGSTTRWEQQPRAMERALERHDAILRQTIDAYGGQVVKTVGDAFIAVFTTVPAALEAALAAQRTLGAEDWGPGGLLRVRMALHAGAPQLRDGDYFGAPMNRAARILAAGHGGQVLLSLSAQELARDLLPPAAALRDLGEHRLKDLGRPERIFQLVAPGLPADFPPLNAIDRFRHNLPPQATPLIGREAEAEQLGELLDTPRVQLLTLTGPGGIGKTRLALQVAVERLERYRDGVLFVALAPISDPAQVVVAIAQALGLREQPGQPLLELLQAVLKPRELLLVLDNFEQVIAAAGAVGAILSAAPQVHILVTSRETLKLYGEQEYAVPPLALPEAGRVLPLERLAQVEAVRLFIERAQAVRPDFVVTAENAPIIAEICIRLDGLPLAIELAAARSKLFPPKALLARLDQRLRLLSGGPRDLPARQQTLTNAIAWSYDLLDATEQVLFTRLGVFVGGCTLEAAEAVTGDDGVGEGELAAYVPREAVLDGLSALVDRSLLRQVESKDGEPRFTMLETIRAFALERLAANGEERALRARHTQHYHDLADHGRVFLYGPAFLPWRRRHRLEWPNIRAAVEWSLTQGDPALALSVVAASRSYWFHFGYDQADLKWLPLLHQALHDRVGTLWLRARARLAVAGWESTMNDQWRRILEPGDGQWEPVDDVLLEADRLRILATAGWNIRDTPPNESLLKRVLALPRVDGDAVTRGYALDGLAEGHIQRGEERAAQAALEEKLKLFRDAQCVINTAQNLMMMAVMLDAPESQRTAWLNELAQLGREMGSHFVLRAALRVRILLACDAGDYAQAASDYEAMLALPEERGLAFDLVAQLLAGRLAHTRGDLPGADQAYRRLLALIPMTPGYRIDFWRDLIELAQVAYATGDARLAARRFGAAAQLFDAFPYGNWYSNRASKSRYEQALAATRAALGEEAFAAAFAAGKALSLEQAVAEILAGGAA